MVARVCVQLIMDSHAVVPRLPRKQNGCESCTPFEIAQNVSVRVDQHLSCE
jgi:hypothetical protein